MFKPLSLFIGLRYTSAKRRNHFISFISMMSMVGIALGVAVLITVLSVMNGFDEQISKQVFSMTPQVTVGSYQGGLANWRAVEGQLTDLVKEKKIEPIEGMAPYVSGQGMLSASDGGSEAQPVLLTGFSPEQESQVSKIQAMATQGSFKDLSKGSFEIAIGQDLAANLGVHLGDKVTVITPTLSLTPISMIPRFKQFTVGALFPGDSFNSKMAYMNISDAQALFNLGHKVTGVRLKILDGLEAPNYAYRLEGELPDNQIGNWSDFYGPLFHAIAMEKNMMFLILLLIIMVAVFNLVSSLVMVVNEKQSDIAIMRTLGMRAKTVMHIFVVQGALIGFVGTFLGVTGGILLSLNVTSVVNFIQHVFGVQFISSSVYFINYLPSSIHPMDVIKITLLSLLFSWLATLYPAWRASRMQPVEALRYE